MPKGCTVHSYKGWEGRALVIVNEDGGATERLLYVALGRVKGDPFNRSAFVTVVNTVARFNSFGSRFERHIGPDEVPALRGQVPLDLYSENA